MQYCSKSKLGCFSTMERLSGSSINHTPQNASSTTFNSQQVNNGSSKTKRLSHNMHFSSEMRLLGLDHAILVGPDIPPAELCRRRSSSGKKNFTIEHEKFNCLHCGGITIKQRIEQKGRIFFCQKPWAPYRIKIMSRSVISSFSKELRRFIVKDK